MAEKLITVNGGGRIGGNTQPVIQINEEVEIPILLEGFEREYSPNAESGPEQVELPLHIIKESIRDLHTVPGSKIGKEV